MRISDWSSDVCSSDLEEQRIVEDLHHEVLPVDVYPPPEVGEAGRESVVVGSGCQVESEEMQHSRDEVEIAGDAQIEQEISHEVLRQRIRVDHRRRADSQVVVDDPVEDEVEASLHHPVDADLIS